MNTAKKGATAERKARKILEDAGFTTARSAGSKGIVDVFAWDATSIRLIQVKAGTGACGAVERETFRAMPAPPNASKEVWRFPDRCRAPLIDRL